jgi:hypothetical protein
LGDQERIKEEKREEAQEKETKDEGFYLKL